MHRRYVVIQMPAPVCDAMRWNARRMRANAYTHNGHSNKTCEKHKTHHRHTMIWPILKKKPNARCILSSCLLLGCNLILHFSRARSPSGWVTFVAAPKNTTTTKPMVVFDWARFVALNMYIIHNFVQMFAIGIDRQASTTTAPLNSIGATTKKCQLICYPASPFYPNKTHTISIILVKCWMLRDFCSPIIVMWLWPSHGCVCERARCCCSIRRPAKKKYLRSHGFQMLRDHTWTAMHTMHTDAQTRSTGPARSLNRRNRNLCTSRIHNSRSE